MRFGINPVWISVIKQIKKTVIAKDLRTRSSIGAIDKIDGAKKTVSGKKL
jgi:hypothetical protein